MVVEVVVKMNEKLKHKKRKIRNANILFSVTYNFRILVSNE